MNRTVRAVAVGATSVVVLIGAGISLDASGPSLTAPRGATAAVDLTSSATGAGAQLAGLLARTEQLPGDWSAWSALALARVDEARRTGDATQYDLAERAVARSFEIHPEGNLTALLASSALAAARHDFTEALTMAESAIMLSPDSAAAHGAAADALVELGRYDEAEDAVFAALDRRPGVANLARASYLFELRGESDRAVDAMQRAAELASQPGDIAFTSNHLGTLAFDRGDLDEAEEHFARATTADPSWSAPSVGIARVTAARGDLAEARARMADVLATLPLPEYVAFAAELALVDNDVVAANQLHDLLGVQRRLLASAGVNADLEMALAEADRGEDPDFAIAIAKDEWERRKSIHVADAYGWALHAAGRYGEALNLARQAVDLGTQSALLHFHLGMIEAALGNDAAARESLQTALRINASFSPRWAPVAMQTLTSLGGERQ